MTATTDTETGDIPARFVQASTDLLWLAEHGLLAITARFLSSLRRETEQEELTARLEAARDAAKAAHVEHSYAPQSQAVPTGDLL